MGFRHAQISLPFTGVIKKLVIINVAIWLIFQVIGEGLIFKSTLFTEIFGLSTQNVVTKFFIWEPFTYMFLHSQNIFHILLNMLTLWWMGSELQQRWGDRFFLIYYLVSGAGAGVLYVLTKTLYYILVYQRLPDDPVSVVGASGAVFGLMLAYGILFGDRVLLFMFIFPMKARVMVMILAAIQVLTLLQNGIDGGGVSNLAHLGGFVSGYVFLVLWTRYYGGGGPSGSGGGRRSNRRKLKLVVSNDDESGPKYWN
jgi:membrane associated rhomboid family serine protease